METLVTDRSRFRAYRPSVKVLAALFWKWNCTLGELFPLAVWFSCTFFDSNALSCIDFFLPLYTCKSLWMNRLSGLLKEATEITSDKVRSQHSNSLVPNTQHSRGLWGIARPVSDDIAFFSPTRESLPLWGNFETVFCSGIAFDIFAQSRLKHFFKMEYLVLCIYCTLISLLGSSELPSSTADTGDPLVHGSRLDSLM